MKNSPLIVAHRGNSGEAPENTLLAFQQAWSLGTDWIELDYRHSINGVPMVIHDETIDRTTNAVKSGYLQNTRVDLLTASQLAGLDNGDWPDGRWQGVSDCRLSRLEDVLKLVVSHQKNCVIERKSGDAATLCELIQTHDLLNQIVVIAFEKEGGWEFLKQCRARLNGLRVGYLIQKELNNDVIDHLRHNHHAPVVNCNHQLLNADLVQRVTSSGMECWAWTVNDVDRAWQLWEWGVNVITTDYPGRMVGHFSRYRSL